MFQSKSKNFYIEIILLICAFLFYLSWAIIQPFNSAPDEEMRYQIAEFIFNNGFLPHGGDPSIRNPIWGISYGFTPILAYIIGAFFMKVTSIFTNNSGALLVSARMVSVLCSTGTVFMSIKIGKKLFTKDCNNHTPWIFIALISFLPQFVFISSYVNNDSLALFSTSLIIYGWILGLESDWDFKSCIFFAIAISLCALSYYNAYGFILCSIILFIISGLFFYNKKQKNHYTVFITKASFISVIVILLCGWWFIRNFIIYDGDFLGLETSNYYGDLYAMDDYKPSRIATPLRNNLSLKDMLINMKWMKFTYGSFIGMFGYMSIPLHNWMYILFIAIFILGVLGFLLKIVKYIHLRKIHTIENKKLLFYVCMFVSCIIPNILSIIYSYTVDFEPQGRYILPMLIPFIYFISKGIYYILNKFIKNTKVKYLIEETISLICIFVSILCFTNIIIPTYCK